MADFPEILSLEAMLETMLSKVRDMKKKMTKQPSKRAINEQAIFDREMVRQRKIIERRQSKRKAS